MISFLENVDYSADLYAGKKIKKNEIKLNNYYEKRPQVLQRNGLMYQK